MKNLCANKKEKETEQKSQLSGIRKKIRSRVLSRRRKKLIKEENKSRAMEAARQDLSQKIIEKANNIGGGNNGMKLNHILKQDTKKSKMESEIDSLRKFSIGFMRKNRIKKLMNKKFK